MDKKWKVIQELGSVKKNKYDDIRVRKCELDGVEYVQLQIWRTNQDGSVTPMKGGITFRSELKDDIVELVKKA
jgi:hypothetical protein